MLPTERRIAMKYRVVLRQFEYDKMMEPGPKLVDLAGRAILSQLFPPTYDLSKGDRVHEHLQEQADSFRTLDSIHRFDGGMTNCGLYDFLAETHPLFWFEVLDAFERIGALEIREKYIGELERLFGKHMLNEVRSVAYSGVSASEAFSRYETTLESLSNLGSKYPFNSAYREKDRIIVDQLLREYLLKSDDGLVCICDGDEDLDREWLRSKLDFLVQPYLDWLGFREVAKRDPFFKFTFGGFGLIFTKEAMSRLGPFEFIRYRRADRILGRLVEKIRSGKIEYEKMTLEESPVPQMTIDLGKTWLGTSRMVLEYSEKRGGLLRWKINQWR